MWIDKNELVGFEIFEKEQIKTPVQTASGKTEPVQNPPEKPLTETKKTPVCPSKTDKILKQIKTPVCPPKTDKILKLKK